MSQAFKKPKAVVENHMANTPNSTTGLSANQAAAANSGAAAAALRTDVDTINVGGEVRGTAGNAARALAMQDEASRRRPAAKVLLGS